MAEITWTAEAQRWIEDIFGYIAADNPQAGVRTVQGIYERAKTSPCIPRSVIATRHLHAMCAFSYTGITESPTS